MDHTTTEIRIEQWRQIILEANGTSLTKKEFCRQHGIKEKQFYYWQRKIRRQEADRLLSKISLVPVESADAADPGSVSSSFVALDLSTPGMEESSSDPSSLLSVFHPEIIIQINGVNLFIGTNVHESTLQSVIRVVRNA